MRESKKYKIKIPKEYTFREWKNENNELHRVDGPAFEDSNKHQKWYMNGVLHRVDGPAIIFGKYEEFWFNGIKYSKEEYDNKIKTIKNLKKL